MKTGSWNFDELESNIAIGPYSNYNQTDEKIYGNIALGDFSEALHLRSIAIGQFVKTEKDNQLIIKSGRVTIKANLVGTQFERLASVLHEIIRGDNCVIEQSDGPRYGEKFMVVKS